MDSFLLSLLLIVLAPLIIRKYRDVIQGASKHGGTLLDYLDRVNAPLALRAVLRWLVGPLAWLAAQMSREKSVQALIDSTSSPETVQAEGEPAP